MLHPDRSQQLLTYLRVGIQKQRYVALCRLYRRWLNDAQSGDVEALIARCPRELRGHLLVLLHDLLMYFPRAVFGIPCLVQHRFAEAIEYDLYLADSIPFPLTGSDVAEPFPGLHFIGWATPDSPLTAAGGQPATDAVAVAPGAAVCVIALFKASDEGLAYDEASHVDNDRPWLELSGFWWARLLGQLPGNLLVHAHRLMPYPEAVEAARIMAETAGVACDSRGSRTWFVRAFDIEQAKDRARHFLERQAQC